MKCISCKADKDSTEFSRQAANKSGYKGTCKPCVNAARRKGGRWERKYNPERERGTMLKYLYDMTTEQYDTMYEAQNGCCKICHTPEVEVVKTRLHVDHCHATGEVRGLLCSHCNTALGKFGDSPELLRAAALYLEN